MTLKEIIQNAKLRREQKVIYKTLNGSYLFNDWNETAMPFADLIFLNICDLLTDLSNDVIFTDSSKTKDDNRRELFIEYVSFFNNYGKFILNKLFENGYVVIGHSELGFSILDVNQYTTITEGAFMKVKALNENVEVYVMRSETFMLTGKSDKQMLNPFLTFLDKVLNSSNTITARLGALIVSSPVQTNQPAAEIITDTQKKKIEEEISDNYGSLSTQKQIFVWPRPMNTQVISLSSIDNKMLDKLKTCVLAIADRIKVPANQIALIDALSSKAFANGSEMLQGDFAKYQSFERLLNATFVRMANDIGLRVDYTIYNKPIRQITPITPTV